MRYFLLYLCLLFGGGSIAQEQVHHREPQVVASNKWRYILGNSQSDTICGSEAYLPSWFQVTETGGSHLPLVVIDTGGRTISNEPKIDARIKIINNGPGKLNSITDTATDYDGPVGIEVRGQSSQMFPKKSYGFETRTDKGEENKVALLGMPEHDDWVLYAPYSDKTMLRNDITYYLGGRLGRWQPRARFVEVYLNGNYIGVYQLIERIKRGKDRVDIAKMETTDISGDKLTGGYIFKVDKIQDLAPGEFFYSNATYRYHNSRNYAFSYYYPRSGAIVANQREYLRSYILQFENNLNAPWFKDHTNHYSRYIDVDSFIDFQIMNELANNIDGYRYSTYFHKQRDSQGGKMVAGPLWDFDLGYGNLNYSWRHQSTNQWCYTNYGPNEPHCMHWWARLMEDPAYVLKVKTRWSNLRKSFLHTDSVMAYMDRQVEHMGDAVGRNFKRWPILGVYVWPNNFIGQTHLAEVNNLKNWIRQRLTWMDTQWLITTGAENIDQVTDIMIYPNPATERIYIQWPGHITAGQKIEVFDNRGVCVVNKRVVSYGNQAGIDISALPNGIYLIRFTGVYGSTTAKIMKQ
jgi:spore coat protein CotH